MIAVPAVRPRGRRRRRRSTASTARRATARPRCGSRDLSRTWALAQRLKRGDRDAVRVRARGQRLPARRLHLHRAPPAPAPGVVAARVVPVRHQGGLLPALLRRRWRCCCAWAASRRGSRPASRPGGYSKRKQAWIVRDTDAHSWVEAWFDGYGWVTLDPTPAATPARSQIAAIAAPAAGDADGDAGAGGADGQQSPTDRRAAGERERLFGNQRRRRRRRGAEAGGGGGGCRCGRWCRSLLLAAGGARCSPRARYRRRPSRPAGARGVRARDRAAPLRPRRRRRARRCASSSSGSGSRARPPATCARSAPRATRRGRCCRRNGQRKALRRELASGLGSARAPAHVLGAAAAAPR